MFIKTGARETHLRLFDRGSSEYKITLCYRYLSKPGCRDDRSKEIMDKGEKKMEELKIRRRIENEYRGPETSK